VGLKDVAARAGVSIGSVSSVLKNLDVERRIPPATAERIRKSAAELGYLPNINARSLRTGSGAGSTVILALITSFEAPIPLVNLFVTSLRREAEKRGGLPNFALMIEMFSAGELKKLPGLLMGDFFNAAIILNTITEDDRFLARSHLPYPVVLVNRSIPGYSSVVERKDSGARAAEILTAAPGRKRIAVLYGTPLTQSTNNRVQSFLKRAAEASRAPAVEIIADSLSELGGYEAMRSFLASGQKCNGLYAVSDALALGAYQAIKRHGLTVPRDISVLGVGDYEIDPFFDPPLSSVGASHLRMADETSRLLLSQMQKRNMAPMQISLPIHEVLRASTG
jgi:LacI family transcriptional regulator